MIYTTAQEDLSSQIIVIIILLIINAFFAASEMAIISANPVKLDVLIAKGNKKAKLVKKLQENETKLLSTIQVGITLAGFFSSATAASSLSNILSDSFNIPKEISIILITLILSYFTLVLGELFPKRVALMAPEKVAMAFARPISIIKTLFRPIVFILSISSDLLVKIFKLKPKEDTSVSEDEIKAMINNGVKAGTINEKEQELISAIFTFDNLNVKDIMTPRVNVFMLDINTPISKFKKLIKLEQYTRVPIYENNKDNIIGILNLKDIFLFLNSTYTKEDIKDILRKPIFVTETMKCNTLLKELQNKKSQSAIVIDETGSVSGYVTLEDELQRAKEFSDAAKEGKFTLILFHVGGTARRGSISDSLISASYPGATACLIVKSGNEDGYFTTLSESYNVDLYEVEKTIELKDYIVDLYDADESQINSVRVDASLSRADETLSSISFKGEYENSWCDRICSCFIP